ncbi:GspE/PulE family protein [Patescibacteria group bacterium]|nr:GspE/PulE family protein [Patescibacteria group bacterium]
MPVSEQQLKAFLLDKKLVSEVQVNKAEKIARSKKKDLESVLLSQKIVSEKKLIELKAYILGIPFIDLEKIEIHPDILKIIPEPIARKHNIVAIKKTKQELEIAMLDPADLQTIDFIKKTTNLKIKPRLASPKGIDEVIKQYQKSLKAEFGDIIEKESKKDLKVRIVKGEKIVSKDLKKVAEELPIIRIVDTLIKHAVLQRASDIHVEPAEKEVIVRYRIDGILHDAMILPKQVNSGLVARIKVLSNLKLDEHRLPQDGRFKIEIEKQKISFRVSILPIFFGEKIVMRLLPETGRKFTLESLGFWGESLERINRAIKKPYGMILATGPTGCGKTTTLYTVLETLNKPGVNICTIEDPIEYQIPRINQTQVKPKIGFTFANGLRSLVRQDPDIILVGEIRDEETAGLAVNAALTGHLVLSTLHTNTAAGAMPRLIDMGIEPFLISSTVNIILAQRLARQLHPEAREKYHLTSTEIKELSKEINMNQLLIVLKQEKIVAPDAKWETIDFYKPKRTKEYPDGYKGRVGIREALEMTETIKEMIVKRATSDQIQVQARKEGMLTMLEDGFVKAIQGLTSLDEVLRVTSE